VFIPVTFRMMDGLAVYNRRLEGIASRAEDLTVPLKQIGADLIKDIGSQFATQGGYAYDWPHPGAGPWRPLTDRYRQWKEQHYPGRPILVASGTMRRAVLAGGKSMTVTPHHLLYTPAEAWVVRRYRYRREGGKLVVAPHARAYDMAQIAYYHQTGAGHNPHRPMVAFPLSELREWDRTLLSWLNGREPLTARL
jgi:hypothetical protein